MSVLTALDYTDDWFATTIKVVSGVFLNIMWDETVFVTGFPGFIAGRLVKRLASEGARVVLLVQPALIVRARQEVEQIANETSIRLDNFSLLQGDITKPDLGLASADLDVARRESTAIFHLAAVYDLAVSRELAMLVNVEGTKHVNDFARAVRSLSRYHYISTCYVAGKRKGVISETDLRHDAGFRNHYEEAKYLAELSVEALKDELPVTIHRPAVVCGDSQTGETAKYDGIYYLLHYLRMWPGALRLLNIGNDKVRLNLVPVDFVIEAMMALAKDEGSTGATVQIADPEPLTTHQLFNELAKAVSGRESFATVPAGLVYRSLMLPPAPKITGLPHSAVPYFFLDQTYDTARAQALLDPHGVRCPAFSEYVPALVDFVEKHPRLK